MINLNELCTKSLADATTRQANGANIKNDTRSMLKHCSTEVVEAMEAYTKWTVSYDGKKHFESELADIICCCLIIAGKEEIDIENAIQTCIEKNHKRAEMIGDKL
jgi:NTP pyrophosphatase (non-canonical NTP hydrolase)